MKNLLILFAFLFSSLAISADFLPTSLKFRKTLDDDVSMTYSQTAYIYVKNISGSEKYVDKFLGVALNGKLLRGLLYGPDNMGGSIYGPVPNRKIGKIIVRQPVGTLRHCQKVKVQSWITAGEKTLVAYEWGNNKPCLMIPPIRPITRPFPRPIIRR